MIWLLFLVSSAIGECETSCYVGCLSKEGLNACTRRCCKFDHILFEDEKVFFVQSNEKIEVELEETFFEIPVLVPSAPVRTEEKYRPPESKKSEGSENYANYNTMCERKCAKYCEGNIDTCYSPCTLKHCTEKQPEAPQSYLLYIILGISAMYVGKSLFAPKNYIDGYTRLD